MLSIQKHGDCLEQRYYDEIITYLEEYEVFWEKFIGNDGNANIIKTGDEEIDEIRVKASQYTYTIFESVVCLYRIQKKGASAQDLEEYLDANNDFILFQAHSGRIRDSVIKLGNLFNIQNLNQNLDGFYAKRNEVLHGIKIPFTLYGDLLRMPEVQEGRDSWHDKKNWDDVDPEDFEFVTDKYEELYTEMIDALRGVFSKLILEVNKQENLKQVIEFMNNQEPSEEKITCSGITENHSLPESFVGPISGSASTQN